MGERKGRYQGKRLITNQEANTAAAERQGQQETKGGFWRDYGYLLITAAVVILVFRVLLQLAYVPSGSMETTIPENSLLISWQLPYLVSDPQPQRGDIVTFWNAEESKLLVKRVIGLPGDTVSFSGGYVYVNGEMLEEDYLDQQGVTDSFEQDTYQVPEDSLLMLGDNRTGSKDSRLWNNPYVTRDTVRARVMICIPLTYWHRIPLPQLGGIRLVG